MPRRYDVENYPKHKRPKGWGSLCPDGVTLAFARELLDTGVQVGHAVFNIDGDFCYRAFCHQEMADGTTLWHGHPIAWCRLPKQAKRELIVRQRLTQGAWRKALRKGLGREFET